MLLKKTTLTLFVLINFQLFLLAQVGNNMPSVDIEENVIFSTDRTLYIAGETILFKANSILSEKATSPISNVLYIELYDKNFKVISKSKAQIKNGICVSSMEIPSDIITGNYYIRAYTQYMRNFKKELFYTNQLTIINPDLPSKDVIQTIKIDSSIIIDNKKIELKTDKENYSPRSLVTLNLKGEKNANVCISVVKKGSYQETNQKVNVYFKAGTNTSDTSTKQLEWLPETRAVSISGKVRNLKDNSPMGNILVYASTMDSSKQFHITRTKT
ncbi:MAG TPA: MG2 domain-containing protein, partial [Bacteroidia bacterium]|nr:MG2 domain-containing protein [Bacteroidia bacterium]